MADGGQTNTARPMEFRLADLRVGEEDPRGRVVRDIFWAVDEFKIYRTGAGISPFFSDEPEIAAKQRSAYLALGAEIAEFNHLIHTMRPTVSVWIEKFKRKRASAPDNNGGSAQKWFAQLMRFFTFAPADTGERNVPEIDSGPLDQRGDAEKTPKQEAKATKAPKRSGNVAKTPEQDGNAARTPEREAKGSSRPVWDQRPARLIHFERELARCLAQAFLGEIEEARSALRALRDNLAERISNRARAVHLFINLMLVCLLGILMAFVIGTDGAAPNSHQEMALAIVMGGLGALFSTATRLQNMEIDPTLTQSMHWIFGGQRVLVGALGALVLYFGFRSGIVTGFVQPVASDIDPSEPFNIYWVCFVSLLAGFSERLVPNLLSTKAEEFSDDRAEPGATTER